MHTAFKAGGLAASKDALKKSDNRNYFSGRR